MRLEQYLNEGRSKSISEDDAIKIIKKRCMKSYTAAFHGNTVIYRGVTGSRATMEIDPKKGEERPSRNTDNYYTLFMDNEGTFKNFPKRSRSMICSTSSSKALGYGNNVYVILPEDNAKIGMVKHRDIWIVGQVSPVRMDLGYINEIATTLIDDYMVHASTKDLILQPYDANWSKFKKINDLMIKIHKEHFTELDKELKEHSIFYKEWMKHNGSILDFYKSIMSLSEFDLKKAGDKFGQRHPNNEVWTDGYSIMIDSNTWDELGFHDKIVKIKD